MGNNKNTDWRQNFTVRLSESELDTLDKKARNHRLTKAQFMRSLITNTDPNIVLKREILSKINRSLSLTKMVKEQNLSNPETLKKIAGLDMELKKLRGELLKC